MSSTPSSADASSVDVWLARDPQLRAPELLAGFARILPAEELQRVERMQFPEGRHQQLVTRALVRNVLSHYLPSVPPSGWRFEQGEQGRPAVSRDMSEDARALRFNLAHTPGLVVMAVGRVPEIGVDVERIDPRVRLAVARRYFSAAEVAALDGLPAAEQPRRFQRLWTLKEAYLKATGAGIVGGLGSMTFHLEGEGVRFERATDPDASRWQFREFEVAAEFLVALACVARDLAPLEVTLRDYLPGGGAPSGQEERAQP